MNPKPFKHKLYLKKYENFIRVIMMLSSEQSKHELVYCVKAWVSMYSNTH